MLLPLPALKERLRRHLPPEQVESADTPSGSAAGETGGMPVLMHERPAGRPIPDRAAAILADLNRVMGR
jgi:hypothetical protein